MRGDIALFMGLVAIIGGGITVAFVFIFGGSGGGSTCDSPLASIGESDISQFGFQTRDVGLTRVIQAAYAGNLEAVTEVWLANDSELRNFTHNVDPSLREVDEALGRKLCEAVISIEEELALDRRPAVVARQATRIRDILRDAAEALGYAPPSE